MAGKRQPVTLKLPRDFNLPTRVNHPSEKSPFWEVKKVVFPNRIIGTILYDSLFSANWHRVSDRTIPCFRNHGVDCVYHGPGSPRTDYQATVPLVNLGSNLVFLVNLTAAAVRECVNLDERSDLFGCELTAWRMPGGPRQKMCCSVTRGPRECLNPKMKITHDEIWKALANIYGFRLEHEPPPPDTVVAELPFDSAGN